MNKQRKYILRFAMITMAFIMCLTLMGCKITQNYANKINAAYRDSRPYTYNDVILHLGDTFDRSNLEGTPSTITGTASWYQGYGNSDSDKQKFIKDNSNGKKIKAICIQFNNGYAIKAEYFVVNEDE